MEPEEDEGCCKAENLFRVLAAGRLPASEPLHENIKPKDIIALFIYFLYIYLFILENLPESAGLVLVPPLLPLPQLPHVPLPPGASN